MTSIPHSSEPGSVESRALVRANRASVYVCRHTGASRDASATSDADLRTSNHGHAIIPSLGSSKERSAYGVCLQGSRGKRAKEREYSRLPLGQCLVEDLLVLSGGRTARIPLEDWTFTIESEMAELRRWS